MAADVSEYRRIREQREGTSTRSQSPEYKNISKSFSLTLDAADSRCHFPPVPELHPYELKDSYKTIPLLHDRSWAPATAAQGSPSSGGRNTKLMSSSCGCCYLLRITCCGKASTGQKRTVTHPCTHPAHINHSRLKTPPQATVGGMTSGAMSPSYSDRHRAG